MHKGIVISVAEQFGRTDDQNRSVADAYKENGDLHQKQIPGIFRCREFEQ
jgi:hypothetical protein